MGKLASDAFVKGIKRRHRRDAVLAVLGLVALLLALTLLVILLSSIVMRGHSAFVVTKIQLPLDFSQIEGPSDTAEARRDVDARALLRAALEQRLGAVEGRQQESQLMGLMSNAAAFIVADRFAANADWAGTTQQLWVPASADVDQIVKGNQPRDVPAEDRRVSDRQLAWIDELKAQEALAVRFNDLFFTRSDSRDAASAGIFGALIGSAITLAITLALVFPVAVGAAVYLEEFAADTWWTRLIEGVINNLAAVPSIVFGLLGLAIFLKFFGMPRSAPVVGGLVLALMTLPIIVVSARASLKAVPPQLRTAALACGASHQVTVWRQVVPQALPGMLTGTILGMAQALGETAPLLLIGMIAFISSPPTGPLDSATVLPAQIYSWFTNPETAYREKASGAIMILLAFLLAMNAGAVWLRQRLQRRL